MKLKKNNKKKIERLIHLKFFKFIKIIAKIAII
jgi:hypothetical protein